MAASLTATYDGTLSRVKLAAAGLNASTAYTQVRRWENAEAQTETRADRVRGEDIGANTSGNVFDYEFAAGVANAYQLKSFNSSDVLLDTVTDTITPAPTDVFLKSILRPFLNRAVTVQEFTDIVTPDRSGVFEIVGRSDPIAVTELRGSRRFTLTLVADDDDEADAIGTVLSFGDVLFIQPPSGTILPTLYASVGEVTRRRLQAVDKRWLDLPLTEVAAPDSTIVGLTATWAGIVSAFTVWDDASGDDVEAEFSTWTELAEFVADPSDQTAG